MVSPFDALKELEQQAGLTDPSEESNGVFERERDNRPLAPFDGPELVVRTLADVKPEPVEFLWEKRIPLGKLTLVAGDPGLGKSWMSLDIAARISLGGIWPDGGRVPHGDVIIVTAEDGLADTVRPRLDRLEADSRRIHSIAMNVRHGEKEIPLSLNEHLPQIEQVIAIKGAIMLVIDPLLAFTGRGVDTHKSSEVRAVLSQVAAMAERSACAVIGIMHLNKRGGETSAFQRITASTDFTAAARSVLVVGKHPDDDNRRVLAPAKTNLSEEPDSLGYHFVDGIFAWEREPVDINVHALLAPGKVDDAETSSALREAKDFLVDVLHDGPVLKQQIDREAKGAWITIATLRRAKDSLAVEVNRRSDGNKGGGGWYWSLPQDAQDDQTVPRDTEDERLANLTPSVSPSAASTPPPRKMFNEGFQGEMPDTNEHLARGSSSPGIEGEQEDEVRKALIFDADGGDDADEWGEA